ncbi:mating-type protein MAT 1-1-1 [Akanthomyces lecanii RCEF 1005]|uniref:Mating-type protein MAT 1-1-1 n=1 Tax=Akanthomyces lecanii RCEF 1005 TaxID=1081108 RepID=A0A168FCW5_CORDF|nr:mating-type protein MAT 1-1-1 [Akanthomyces lecanii RCEF 1005]
MENRSNDLDRQELLRHLSTVPAHTILRHLQEDTIMEIAAKCFKDKTDEGNITRYPESHSSLHYLELQRASSLKKSNSNQAGDRAKRPLNAFIAFRSYYVKLFPESQQKAASGFLTTLWGKDPFRNRWAMIAKVYSFVRDEMGKKKAPLSSFLMAACPAMDILPPDEYLRVLGWAVEDTEYGTKKLVQKDELRAPKETTKTCPDSELELFQGMIELGYMPDENIFLFEALLARDSRSTLTSTISIAERAAIRPGQEQTPRNVTESTSLYVQEQYSFHADGPIYTPSLEAPTPYCATPSCSEEITTPSTCASISTPPTQPAALLPSASTPSHSLGIPSAATISTAEPAAAAAADSYFRPYCYNFVADDSAACSPAPSFAGDSGFGGNLTSHPGYNTAASSTAVLSLDGVADHQAFDIDCPWEIDAILSQCTQAPTTNRLFALSSSPEYDPQEDFHYTF